MNKKNFYRVIALGLTGIMAAGTICQPVKAAAPTVQVDESLYVNLDYYGGISDISVVKGCYLNGNTTIEDYGTYDEIINMSNRVEPVVADGKVTWNLEGEEDQYFYYELKSEDLKKRVPWDIDVSYKVNGVETAGENLAGADGLVTTLVHVTPRDDIEDYYKNNMILICGTLVDMKNTLSIDAPGSQTQSLGTQKAVIFMSLPGEESEYRIDIGTHSYESMGLFFAMVPATLESLEIVNDVRDVKETVEDSVDAMNDAIDVILDNVAGMKDSFTNLEEGLNKAEAAHSTYDDNRETIEADADAALDALTNMVTYLEVINVQSEADKENLDKTIDKLVAMMRSIGALEGLNKSMNSSLDGLNKNLGTLNQISEGTITDAGIQALQEVVGQGATNAQVEALAKQMTVTTAANRGRTIQISDVEDAINGVKSYVDTYNTGNPSNTITFYEGATLLSNSDNEVYISAGTLAKGYVEAVKALGASYEVNTSGKVTGAAENTEPGAAGGDLGLQMLLTAYIAALNEANAGAGDTSREAVANAGSLISSATDALDLTNSIALNLQNMSNWTDTQVREDVMTLIDQLNDLISMTEMTLSSLQATMSGIRSTMELTEDTLSSSITLTLNGLTGIARGGEGIADGVDVMRDAKNTMKDAIDDEMDTLEEDYNFINLDVTQKFPSFTSSQNYTPSSIQIVMRTAEISLDDEVDPTIDIEREREDIGIWGRFVAVFKNLWASIVGLFS
ncbi:MAG: hypothetical protein ACI4FV_01670 [Lachnospiraceae bacterium]